MQKNYIAFGLYTQHVNNSLQEDRNFWFTFVYQSLFLADNERGILYEREHCARIK